MAALTVDGGATGRAVSLISGYLGHPLGVPAKGDVTSAGGVTGLAGCAAALAAAAGDKGAALQGRDALERAQVSEWLTWAATELALQRDQELAALNAWLTPRTYLAASRPTLADLAVLGALQPALAALPGAQTDQLCCLLRWADHALAVAGAAAEGLPRRALQLPAYVPPPPPTPAPAAAAAPAAGKGKGADAAAAAAGGKDGGKKGGDAAGAAGGKKGDKKGDAAPAASDASTATQAVAGAAAASSSSEATSGGKKGGKKADAAAAAANGGKADAAAAGAASAAAGDGVSIDMLDICVGRIVSVQRHPNADALYLEQIDLGEDKPRQVISGLVKFVPQDQMEGRRVVVVTNLKPAKMRDVMSYGMVLCASNDAHDTVDPIIPPEGAPVGTRVTFEGYSGAPLPEVNPKKKILERLLPDLHTDASGAPCYKGVPFMTEHGPVTSTMPNSHVG